MEEAKKWLFLRKGQLQVYNMGKRKGLSILYGRVGVE